jgi:4a-hydroxytetrahydrobiopterin dehydratase
MTNIHLTEQKCEACEGGVPPLTEVEAKELHTEVPEWELNDAYDVLSHAYECADFAAALAFVNRVGEVAESEGHHPDIHLTNYKHVLIELTTHAIGGLSKNDFIVAAKIDATDTTS